MSLSGRRNARLNDGQPEGELDESTLARDSEQLRRIERDADARGFLALESDSTVHAPETEQIDPRHGSFRVIGYVLHERLGSGGTSVVYRATKEGRPDQSYAVKALTFAALDRGARLRFRREVEVLKRLEHPRIAKLYDSGVADNGQPYLILEFVDGNTISQYCQEHQLEIEDRVKLFIEVCHALEYAHDRGTLHRDIKPGNVLVSRDGQPTLTDFGLAKSVLAIDSLSEETRTGAVLGTLNYLAPEQIFSLKHEVDERTDVFGMGALLYRLLSGKPPFEFDNLVEAARDYFRRAPVGIDTDADVPSKLEAICLKCLSARPSDRYSSVAALRRDLERHLAGQSVSVRNSRLLRRASLLHRHNPTLSMTLFGMLVVSIVFGVGFYSLWQSAQRGLQDSQRKTKQLKENILGYADQVRAQEDDPATLVHRRQQLLYIREQLLSLEDEFAKDSELLFAHAVNDFKLGQIEHLLGATDHRLQYFEAAEQSFLRLVPRSSHREQALFGLYHSRLAMDRREEALETLKILCDEHPGNLDYIDARCTAKLLLVNNMQLSSEFKQASRLLRSTESDVAQLKLHADEFPRFHRKVIQANEEHVRLLVHQGKLDEAQELMWDTLQVYEEFDILSSPVVSESAECLCSYQFAIAIAAMRRDSDSIERLYASAKEVFIQAEKRYPYFPHLQEHWTRLLWDCIAARRRFHFDVEMSELSDAFAESLEKWADQLPDDIYRQFTAVCFHATRVLSRSDPHEAQLQMDRLLNTKPEHAFSKASMQIQLIRLGRIEEACQLNWAESQGAEPAIAARDAFFNKLVDQLKAGVPIEDVQFEAVPQELKYRLLAASKTFHNSDLEQWLREIIQDGRLAAAAKTETPNP